MRHFRPFIVSVLILSAPQAALSGGLSPAIDAPPVVQAPPAPPPPQTERSRINGGYILLVTFLLMSLQASR